MSKLHPSTQLPITEDDLRCPEFRGCSIDELERRADGTIARRDRWQEGIRAIAGVLGWSRREWEIADLVAEVRRIKESSHD